MVKNRASSARQRGVTYFWALLVVLFITLGLGKLLENVAMTDKRNRETELLYTGNLYRDAIRQYSQSTPVGGKPYPEKVSDLLRDPRYPVIRRYLRRLYPDPVTGAAFILIPAPGGGVMGVHSASRRKPAKAAGFPKDQTAFSAARSYQQWEFIYAP
ncbi:type II secretion system GspH family protein [Caballeronia sp. dw_19]|uniref:type II secretion system GspH family protein n=1 Tax=Caballeronia sp. dw_19 TaxID=2719791 RepID=UPI001BD28C93|nr:type II secretion system GspH family protein [Caballeronia sp. dw_19]